MSSVNRRRHSSRAQAASVTQDGCAKIVARRWYGNSRYGLGSAGTTIEFAAVDVLRFGFTGAENCSVRSRSVMSTTVSIGAVSS